MTQCGFCNCRIDDKQATCPQCGAPVTALNHPEGTALLIENRRVSNTVSAAAQEHYHLNPPYAYRDWYDEEEHTVEWIVVSAASHMFGTETYIFPSDSQGNIVDWGELPGSMKNTLSHGEVLRKIGYEPIR